MSYESPIRLIEDKVNIKIDNGVVRAVQHYGLTIDKDELIKALNYDREQYEKGFEDGKATRHGKWIYGEDEYGDDGYFCSVCHGHEMWKYGTEPIDFIEAYHYCPFCGAKMDERKE